MPTFRDSQNRTWSLTLNCVVCPHVIHKHPGRARRDVRANGLDAVRKRQPAGS